MRKVNLALKRTFDIVVSIVALVVFTVIFALVPALAFLLTVTLPSFTVTYL